MGGCDSAVREQVSWAEAAEIRAEIAAILLYMVTA
jgi:hypothetical protein